MVGCGGGFGQLDRPLWGWRGGVAGEWGGGGGGGGGNGGERGLFWSIRQTSWGIWPIGQTGGQGHVVAEVERGMAGEWGQGNGVKEAVVEEEMVGCGGGFGQLDRPLWGIGG